MNYLDRSVLVASRIFDKLLTGTISPEELLTKSASASFAVSENPLRRFCG
jgi:hypothetical protein